MSTAAERINWRLRAMLEEVEVALEDLKVVGSMYLQGKRDALKYALAITIQEIH